MGQGGDAVIVSVLLVDCQRIGKTVLVVETKVGSCGKVCVKSGLDVCSGRDGRGQFGHGELRTDLGLVKLQFDRLIFLCRPYESSHCQHDE